MLIDWADSLNFELRHDAVISREDLGAALPAEDLIVRAARALQQASGSTQGVHIGIDKCIPVQAGMGGGSSDAASTLLALNQLWQLDFTLEQLTEIGVRLGADVPFFLAGHNAWVEGVGEQITPVTLPRANFVVLKPAQGIDTGTVFSDPDLNFHYDTATIRRFAADAFAFGSNDLQGVAQKLCPAVTQALAWLEARGLCGRMTGSGSAVFALARQELDLSGVPDAFQARVCKNLDVHPLWGWAQSAA